jgi:hypothetical protein
MYYRGDAMDPSFPAPNPLKDIYVAAEKPSSIASSPPSPAAAQPHAVASLTAITSGTKPKKNPQAVRDANKKKGVTPEDRRLMLNEIKEHLNVLKEFEGVIPAEDLVRRKRELFLAMPPAPPPAKRPRKEKLFTNLSKVRFAEVGTFGQVRIIGLEGTGKDLSFAIFGDNHLTAFPHNGKLVYRMFNYHECYIYYRCSRMYVALQTSLVRYAGSRSEPHH